MKNQPVSSARSRLERLVDDALTHMEGLGYKRSYLLLCRGVWRTFVNFSRESSVEEFAEDQAVRFLASRGIGREGTSSRLCSRQQFVRAAMRILSEFSQHGSFERRRKMKNRVKLSRGLQDVLSGYEQFCDDHLKCTSETMRHRTRHVTRFLCFLESTGVCDVMAMNPQSLSDFVRSQSHLKPRTLTQITSDLRSFLRFLCMEGLVSSDLRPHVPKVRVPRDGHIPSVWTREDVEAILAAVDRRCPKGKRDYAILLLACRLGLRVGDIRKLRLEDIQWNKNQIVVTQSKTGVTVTLPLTEEVGEALIDYLRHGRPSTQHREIFLRMNAPIAPFARNDNLHYLITCYRRQAGVALAPAARQGMHSLRHSFATRLLETGTSFEVISASLGHLSLKSTQIYTKVDIDVLRTAALDVEISNE